MTCTHTKRNKHGKCVACGNEVPVYTDPATENLLTEFTLPGGTQVEIHKESRAVTDDELEFYALQKAANGQFAYEVVFNGSMTPAERVVIDIMRVQQRGEWCVTLDTAGDDVQVFRGPPPDDIYVDRVLQVLGRIEITPIEG